MDEKDEVGDTLLFPIFEKPSDIYAALDNLFGVERVTLNGGKFERYMVAADLPPMLQMFFQKQEYDKDTNLQKIIDWHVELQDTIHMDRYMDTDSAELKDMRSKSRDLTLSLAHERTLEGRYTTNEGSSTDVLDETWQFLSEVEDMVPGTRPLQKELQAVSACHRKEAEVVRQRISDLEEERSLLDFAKFNTAKNAYKLFAVFFHRGVDRAGHYWLYLRDFKSNQWRKYEDRSVTMVDDTKEIFERKNPETAGAPYFIVYVKDQPGDQADEDLTETVHRCPPDVVQAIGVIDCDAVPNADADADGDIEMKDSPEAGTVEESELLDPSAHRAEEDPANFYHG